MKGMKLKKVVVQSWPPEETFSIGVSFDDEGEQWRKGLTLKVGMTGEQVARDLHRFAENIEWHAKGCPDD